LSYQHAHFRTQTLTQTLAAASEKQPEVSWMPLSQTSQARKSISGSGSSTSTGTGTGTGTAATAAAVTAADSGAVTAAGGSKTSSRRARAVPFKGKDKGKGKGKKEESEEESEEEEDGDGGDGGGYRCYNSGDGSDVVFSLNVFGYDITIQQLPSDQSIGHGAVVWEAAVIFAKYIEYTNNKDLSIPALIGKSVLELGSGTGLGGLCMALRGARVTCTDLQPVVSALTYMNMKLLYNQFSSQGAGAGVMDVPLVCPIVYPVDWVDELNIRRLCLCACDVNTEPEMDFQHYKRDSDAILAHFESTGASVRASARDSGGLTQYVIEREGEGAVVESTELPSAAAPAAAVMAGGAECTAPAVVCLPYDIILLTDCVFSAKLVPALIRTIIAACGPRSIVYCVHEIRDVEANIAFLAALGEYFKVKSVPQKEQHPDFRHEQVQVIIAKPRPRKMASNR